MSSFAPPLRHQMCHSRGALAASRGAWENLHRCRTTNLGSCTRLVRRRRRSAVLSGSVCSSLGGRGKEVECVIHFLGKGEKRCRHTTSIPEPRSSSPAWRSFESGASGALRMTRVAVRVLVLKEVPSGTVNRRRLYDRLPHRSHTAHCRLLDSVSISRDSPRPAAATPRCLRQLLTLVVTAGRHLSSRSSAVRSDVEVCARVSSI